VKIPAIIPGRIGECRHGDSPEEVIPQLKDIAAGVVAYLTGKGELLPEPQLSMGRVFKPAIGKRFEPFEN